MPNRYIVMSKTQLPLRVWMLSLLMAISAFAEFQPNAPVGLMLTPAGAELIREGAGTVQKARAGDLLYAGDTVRAGQSAATFVYCPGRRSLTITPAAEVVIYPSKLTFNKGEMASQRAVTSCFLPSAIRLAEASTQKYGVLVSRGETDAPEVPTPIQRWPAGLAGEVEPIARALQANQNDPVLLLACAALFENYGLPVDAIIIYRELARVWKDTAWINGKITELNQDIARRRTQPGAYSGIK